MKRIKSSVHAHLAWDDVDQKSLIGLSEIVTPTYLCSVPESIRAAPHFLSLHVSLSVKNPAAAAAQLPNGTSTLHTLALPALAAPT